MKTKHKYIAILIFLFFSINNFAQQCQWAKHIGSIGIDNCSIANDLQNNIYAFGYYYNECVLLTDTLKPLGRNDLYLIKYNSNGNELWARTIGGLNPFSINFYEYREECGGFIYDTINDCIYISGNFYSTLTIDNYSVSSAGEKDLFLAKLNSDGQCLWLKKAGSNKDDRECWIGLDEFGNVFWSLELKENGSVDTVQLNSKTPLIKISPNGDIQWIKQVINNGFLNRIKVKDGSLYFTNYFVGNITIDSIILNSLNYEYIMGKYDLQTDHIKWLKHLIGESDYDNKITDILLYDDNRTYLSCTFQDSVTIDGITLTNNNGYADNFYLRLDSLGTIDWKYQMRTLDNQSWGPVQLYKGPNNTIYSSGSIQTRGILGQDTITVDKQSAYVTRFDTSGNFIDEFSFGEATNICLLVLQDGSIVVCGLQTGTTTICDTSFTNFPGELAGMDNYIAKFDAITGLQNIIKPNNNKLLIYANPTSGLCNISIPTEFEHEKNLILYVYDQQGRLLKQASVEMDEERIRLNMEALAKGMYTAVLSNGKKQFSGKIIFQ